MKRKTGKGSAWVTGLLVLAALALTLWPAEGRTGTCPTLAVDICNAVTNPSITTDDPAKDCDEDGFSDHVECYGFDTGGSSVKHYYGYNQSGRPTDRASYLDPTGKDLFLAVAKDNPSNILQADLDYVAATLGSQLGVVVHFISSTDFAPNPPYNIRQVTLDSLQKGVVIVENSTTTTGADRTTLGLTNPITTPDSTSLTATVFTGRLESYVNETVCPVATYPKCVTSDGRGRQSASDTTGLATLKQIYHRQNIIHELSHAMSLANVAGGHQPVETASPYNNWIMSQYVYSKPYAAVKKTSEPAKQVFYIPFTYQPGDATALKLK